MICKDCGNEYSRITTHWSQTSCKYPEVSDDELELFEGLLLGDGTIPDISNTKRNNTFLAVEMVTPRFLYWLVEQSQLFTKPRLKDEYVNNNNWNATYVAQTISIPEISDIRNRWYPKGKKKYPTELTLTPFMAKLWYCGDGGLNWSGDTTAYANIKCSNESANVENLLELFREHGFGPTFRQERICFNSDTKEFLEWIGKPLPGFEYKWETTDRGSYDELQNLSYKEPIYGDDE